MAFHRSKQLRHLIPCWDSRAQEAEELQPTKEGTQNAGLVMCPPHDCLSLTRSRAVVWSNSRPTPRRQEKDLLRKQKLGILAAVRSTLRALHSRFGRAF